MYTNYEFLGIQISIPNQNLCNELDNALNWSFNKNEQSQNFFTVNSLYDCVKEEFCYDSDSNIFNCYYRGKYNYFSIYSVIREYIVKSSLTKGIVWFHASAFMIHNKVILVIGKKNSGKTTWLLEALVKSNAQFVGNDQIPVFESNGKLYTQRWRPEIKVKYYNDLIKNALVFGNKESYNFFDINQYNNITGNDFKKLYLKFDSVEKIKSYEINSIIYLDEMNCDIQLISDKTQKHKMLKNIECDTEYLSPVKLENWNKVIPYWNKRINFIKFNKNSLLKKYDKFKECFVSSVNFYSSNNRLDKNVIKGVIDNL